MTDESSSPTLSAPILRRPAPPVISSGSVSGEAHAPTLVTSGTHSTGERRKPAQHGKSLRPLSPKVEPKVKHACYALFTACIDDLERALDHDSEFFLRNNALEQLKRRLTELWEIRG